MKYEVVSNGIRVFTKAEFNSEHILECGQVFCYQKEGEIYKVFPGNEYAEIVEFEEYYLIMTKNPQFFVNFFDLNCNYSEIKEKLSSFKILEEPLKFGGGIRILNQDLFETMISFIISANNNIKRIKLILNNIRKNLGKQISNEIYSFPTYNELFACDEEFFKKMGAGYRAKYLYNVLRQIGPKGLEELASLSSQELRQRLLSLSGIGPKVADCLMLFGFHRGDVFPVDTWIHQMYNTYYKALDNREIIRKNLVDEFGELAGFAQQYLFYYQRSFNQK